MDRGNIAEYVRNLNNSRDNLPEFNSAISCLKILFDKLNLEKNPEEIARFIDVVLDENTGIWSFLRDIKGHRPSKQFVEITSSFFELICQRSTRLSGLQTRLLFDYCRDIIRSSTLQSEIKDLAYKLFSNVIEYGNFQFFADSSSSLENCVHNLYFNLEKSKPTEKRQIYELIGSVAENCPDVLSEDVTFITKVYRRISTELPKILKKQDGSGIGEVEGMVKCIDGLLLYLSHGAESYIDTLYDCLKKVTERTSTKHVALRAVIQIIEKHFSVFAELIKKDYKFWQGLLSRTLLSNNKDDSLAAKKALQEFYQNIAKLLVEKSENNKEILRFFLSVLHNDVRTENQHNTEVALKSFIHFAEACKIQEETTILNDIFTLTMSLLDKYCVSFSELDNDSILNLSSILKSTSQFLRHLSGEKCNEEYFQILANASVLSISAYAKTPEKMKSFISQPLLETIVNVANLNELHLDSFLDRIIYDGIVMCCSPMPVSDVECLKEACGADGDFNGDDLLTIRDYLPIWKKMLGNLQNNKDRQLIYSIDLEGKICDKVVGSMLRIIEKLDITMKECDQSNQDVDCLILVEYDTVPSNLADFNVFINVVELFFELFDKWSHSEHKFHKWVPILVPKLIELTTYNDVKFGFYKMLAVVFKYVERDDDYDINEVKLFVLEELNHLSERPKTDSRACLQMVMSLPVKVVEELLLDIVPALKLAFERGSEDLSLATEALECLEKWYLKVDKDKFKPVLSQLIPYLKPFIQSKRFAGETISLTNFEKNLMKKVYTKMGSKSNRNRKYRRAYMQSEESELDALQKKLVKFLGKIDTQLWIPVFTPDTFVDREAADLLQFALHFENMKIDLFLDKFLPRLIDLACNSSDFNTRRDACEAFHSCVVVFLGENRSGLLEQDYPQYTTSLFKKIVVTVFRLSTDDNSTIQQMFIPLAKAMTRYYSRRLMKTNITDAFPEILYDAVASTNDATYRKFIARLIKEYVSWSLKPGGETKNVRKVIEHVCLFCLQSCSFKKLGAAITFNSIYEDISRNEGLRDEFWIELLLHFVRNLSTSSSDDCNIREVKVAIDKLVETIRKYFSRFNREDRQTLNKRRIPNWFDGSSLFEVQVWLFQHCLYSNELCRKKCMQTLFKLLDENEGRPPLKNFLAMKALDKFKAHSRTFPALNNHNSLETIISWLTLVSASLDCFLWIIDTKSEKIQMFDDVNYKLRFSVEYFLASIVDKDLKSLVSDPKIPITSGQKKQFDLLREDIIYMILKMASISQTLSHSLIGEPELFKRNFQSTFIKCLFEPHLMLPHKQSRKELPSVLEKILENLKTHPLADKLLADIYHHKYWTSFSDILDNPQRTRTEHRSNPQALSVLKNCQIKWPISEMTDLQNTIRKIFFYIRQDGTMKAIVPDTTIVSYFQDYLLFALKARYGNEFHRVADYIFCVDQLVSVSGKATFSHGLHFFNMFRIPILEYLVDHQDEFIDKCVDNLNLEGVDATKNPDTIKILVTYLEFASTKKKKDCSSVLGHWRSLKQSLVHSNIDLSDLLKVLDFSIREMDMTKVDSLAPVYDWLLDYLRSADIKPEIVHQILDLLPAFMGFEFCTRYDDKLKAVLKELRREQIDCKIKAEGLVVYNKLLNGLARSANRILFETVVEIALDKEASFQDNISAALSSLMNRSSDERLRLLDMPWDMFKNPNNDVKLRMGSMELFLLPMMNLIQDNPATVEEFYANKIQSIYQDLQLNVEDRNNTIPDLVSLIGAVIMLESYYKIMANPENPRIKAIIFGENENGTLNAKFAKIALAITRNGKIQIDDENKDLVFKLKSHALNALIGVLQNAIKDYESAQKWGKIIFERKETWFSVIKLEPPIRLTMTLEQIRARGKEIIRKRKQINASNNSSSIATQYASMSSLAPEVSKYDANHFTVKSSQSSGLIDDIELYNEEREIDVLNSHVSMNALCNFVRFLEEKRYLVEEYDENEPEFPDWMAKLRDSLRWFINRPKKFNEPDDRLQYQNCILYILKFITNCETAFRHFAKHWLDTLVECLCKLNQMNYVITDVVLMLLQWHDRVVPENRNTASNLFKMFTLKIIEHQSNSKTYLREMMKAMIHVWHRHFDVPYVEINSMIRSNDKETYLLGLHLCEWFLQCGIFPYNEVNRTFTMSLFLEKLTDQKHRWNNKQVATILGLILKTASKDGDGTLDPYYQNQKTSIVNNMKNLNNSASVKTVDSFVLMEHLIAYYPPMLEEFSYHFLQRFNNLQGDYKKNCLKVLTNNVEHVPDDAFSNLFSCNFESALQTNEHDLSVQALLLIKTLLSEDRIKVRIEDLLKIKEDLRRLSVHETPQCRKAAYGVADSIYKKYRDDEDERAKDYAHTCKGILLAGLLDSDAELQQDQFKSWEERLKLEKKVDVRFLNIIKEMYHPQHESHFVSYAVNFLLEACASTEEYNSAIFSRPLESGSFMPYQIISTKSKKLSSLAPCFRNSIPYQLASLGTNPQTIGSLSLSLNRTPGTSTINIFNSAAGSRSTRMYTPGSYHPLKYISPVPAKSTAASETKPFDMIGRTLDRLKKRIIADSKEASNQYAIYNAKLNEETCQILANQSDRRDRKVDLKRQYRRGDYPDIEIKRSELIRPLQTLAKRDPVVAKLLFSNVFLSMVNKIKEKKEDYLRDINEAFCKILNSTEQCGTICLEAIFEVAYSLPTLLQLDIKSVVVASNMNNLLSLRALLLENSLIYGEANDCGPSAAKRARIENSPENYSSWIHLAEVYKSLNRYDVVNGIFKEKIQNNYCQLLKKGLELETVGDWEGAYEMYNSEVEKLTEMNDTSHDQRFILDAYYKCAAYLSKWDEMRDTIKNKFKTVENILKNNWHKECTLPWYFLSQAYETVFHFYKSDDYDDFRKQMIEMDQNNDPLFLDVLAEPSSMLFFIYGNQKKSQNLVKRSLDLILKEFNFGDSSMETFLKLQTLSEIDIMLSVLNDDQSTAQFQDKISEILEIWKRCEPNKDHSTWWDRRLVYRHRFAKKYIECLDTSMDDAGMDYCQLLNNYEFLSKLQFCEKALDQQNYHLAVKYTTTAEQGAREVNTIPEEWNFMKSLNLCKIKTFRADEKKSIGQIQGAIVCMRQIYEMSKKCDYKTSMAVSNLLKVIKRNCNEWPTDSVASLVRSFPDAERFDERTPLMEKINTLIAENYTIACETAERNRDFSDTQISSAYLALAKHCREVSNEASEENINRDLQTVKSILCAMKYNSKEAYQLFPVLLDLRSVDNEEFQEKFKIECAVVEEWKFLSWINQLLVYLYHGRVSMIGDLIVRMARKYPNAFYFPFLLSQSVSQTENIPKEVADVVRDVEIALQPMDHYKELIKALTFVCAANTEPSTSDGKCKGYVRRLNRLLDEEKDPEKICEAFDQVQNEINTYGGTFWPEFYFKYDYGRIKSGLASDKEHVKMKLDKYHDEVNENVRNDRSPNLNSYSKILCDFINSNNASIEVPGQYDGFSLPRVERHVKIFEFRSKITAMCSLKRPIKITLLGDDAKEYSYLVKTNEDIRQDQRIQQLFHIVNQALTSKFHLYSKHLILNTFGVYPLREDLGLIEWVEDTVPLKRFPNIGLNDTQRTTNEKKWADLRAEYEYKNMGGGSYYLTVEKYSSDEKKKDSIVKYFRQTVKQIEEDMYKKSLMLLTTTPHLFWRLRNHFLANYSSMSIASWILGIGDRHLDNILVSLKSGTCIGIDFGLAFGTGTDALSVPELIPFRMTNQITSINAPFGLTGLIRETMIEVLQTIRDNGYVLLATMPVFILDPSIDWCKAARRLNAKAVEQNNQGESYFKNKIENVKLKLEGCHPAKITINELRVNRCIRGYTSFYENVVTEATGFVIGSEDQKLTTEEQVGCLLKSATHDGVLATSYSGLETWI